MPKQPLNHDVAEATRAQTRGDSNGNSNDNDTAAGEIFRTDYRPLRYMVHKVHLNFILKPGKTTVITDLFVGINPNFALQRKQQHQQQQQQAVDTAMTPDAAISKDADNEDTLVLDGQETDVALWSIALVDNDDGGGEQELKRDLDYTLVPGKLILKQPVLSDVGVVVPSGADTAVTKRLRTVVTIVPESNTLLEGLFITNSIYCTQCEADGFRRITYFPDRPDNLALFERVRIETCAQDYPVLLSNGAIIESGIIPDESNSKNDGSVNANGNNDDDNDDDDYASGTNRHYAIWTDVFPKPSYLFALVAGNLDYIEDSFVTTPSQRHVRLRIYARTPYIDKLQYAMMCLKKAMAWDERTFGLECDSDLYQIVAVDDFNAGAMENKGLNIFNAANILADEKTATDEDFARVERIVRGLRFHLVGGGTIF